MGASHNHEAGATGASALEGTLEGPHAAARGLPRAGLALLAALLLTACQIPVLRARTADATAAEQASRSGDWPRAAELWHDVHRVQGGTDVRPYYETARALLHTDDRDSAAAMLERGLLLFPDQPDLLELRARVQSESGFRRAAEESLAQLVAAHPDRISALNALARIRMQLGLEKAALEPLRRLVELTGGDAETYKLMADALRQSGQPVEAFAAYRQAVARGASSHSLLLHGAQLATEDAVREQHPGAVELAFGWLERVLHEDPQRTRAHFVRALLCDELGRTDEAIACYRRAIELDLSSLEALTNLALLYAERGDVDGTLQMVARAIELEQSPGRRAALERLIDRAHQKAAEAPDEALAEQE